MDINGNLVLNSDASGELKNVYLERLSAAPAFNAAHLGRIYFNTTTSLFLFNNGTSYIPFSTGGDAAIVQAEVDAIESSLGSLLNNDGSYNAAVLSGSLAGTSSLTGVVQVLQGLADANASSIAAETAARIAADSAEASTRATADTALQTAITAELDRAVIAEDALSDRITDEVADRTAADTANSTAISNEANARAAADTAFQTALDQEITDRTAADTALDNKIDAAIAGLAWLAAVDELTADHLTVSLTGKPNGYRVVDTTDNKIYTVTSETYNAGVALVDGNAFFDKATDVPYNFNGTAVVQFNGASAVVAGTGLTKTGNTLDITSSSGTITVTADSIDVSSATLASIADNALAISNEETRALAAESGLDTRVDDEIAARAAAITAEHDHHVAGDLAEATARIAADATLQNNIDAEAVNRADEDALLQIFIDNEQASREQADTTLQNNIDAANTARVSGDASAQTNISNEASTRAAADVLLQSNIDTTNDRISSMYFLYEAGSAATSHPITHNLGAKYCNVTVVDNTDNVVIPQAIVFNNANSLTVTFTSALQCRVVIMGLAVV